MTMIGYTLKCSPKGWIMSAPPLLPNPPCLWNGFQVCRSQATSSPTIIIVMLLSFKYLVPASTLCQNIDSFTASHVSSIWSKSAPLYFAEVGIRDLRCMQILGLNTLSATPSWNPAHWTAPSSFSILFHHQTILWTPLRHDLVSHNSGSNLNSLSARLTPTWFFQPS